jgi:hypothetical protein
VPKISREQLIKLQKKLKTDEAIGYLFKISRQAVHQLRNKYGISSIPEKNRERDKDLLISNKKGQTLGHLAKKYNLSVSQTYRIIRKLKQKIIKT